MSQLPSYHLPYTECRPSSKTVMPHGENRCQLQLFFLFDCYRPAFTCYGTDWFSGHCTTTVSCWSFADAVRSGLHRRLRGSVPEPCPVSDASPQPLNRVLECMLLVYLCFLYCYRCLCFFRAFDIFQQFLRIISRPYLQDSVNHRQYLAGYHNQ